MQVKGFINIFKPLNMTSSDVVVKVRGILRRATGEKQKVGHLGTLDPLAVGVLPIAVGNATRLFDYMQNKQKTYVATFKFGVTTDTLDRGGAIVSECGKKVCKDDVIAILPKLIGEVMQMPPQYSAKSINGRKAYDIAREGGVADLKPKKVNINQIELLGGPGEIVRLQKSAFDIIDNDDLQSENFDYILSDNEFAFKITCGSGTYIRAIARDMAELLGTVGYMNSLCRINTGGFTLENAVSLDEFEKNPFDYVLPINIALENCDKLDLDEVNGNRALNGIKINCTQSLVAPIAVSICGNLVGLGEISQGKLSIKTRL